MLTYPLSAAGLQTRIIEAGNGPRAVLFLHGIGARADRWQPTINRYADFGYRCIGLDLPGHGFATKGRGPVYTVPGFASFVATVMSALDIERAALVGTSLGAHVAATLAINSSSRVVGLALVGALGLVPLSADRCRQMGEGVTNTGRDRIAAKLRFVVQDPALVTDRWIEEEWRVNNSPGSADSFVALGSYVATQINEHVVGQRLRELINPPPVCLIWGSEDVAVPVEVGQQAADLLTSGRISLIPGTRHLPYFEAPEGFDAVALPFLDSLRWDV